MNHDRIEADDARRLVYHFCRADVHPTVRGRRCRPGQCLDGPLARAGLSSAAPRFSSNVPSRSAFEPDAAPIPRYRVDNKTKRRARTVTPSR